MADYNKKIVNKVFKILPMYEECFENYYKYLSRVIIELSGEEQDESLHDIVIALKGLKSLKDTVTHDDVRRIIMRYTNKLSNN